jgi:hypothetical protein
MSKKKPKKIIWASNIAVEGLQPFTQEVLDSLAKHTGMKGVAHAMISDMSCVSDMLESEPTGETKPHPFCEDEEVICVTADTETNREIVRKVSEDIGVPVEIYDLIYEVAIRLRDL